MANFNDALLAPDVIANIPAAGIRGRWFFATDEGLMYRDNGSTWVAMPPDAMSVTYAPNDDTDWDYSADPGDVQEGLDQLAARTTDLEAGGGGGGGGFEVLDYVEYATDESVTSLQDLTNLTLSYDQVTGRKYKHVFSFNMLKVSSAAALIIYLTDASNTVIATRYVYNPVGYNAGEVVVFVEEAGSDATVTRKLRASTGVGSVTFNNDETGGQSQFWVEDLG